MYLNINENAIFIADSHYNSNRPILKETLEEILSKKIITDQLFLMGDVFDFLSDDISYFQNKNKDVIDLINQISHHIEVIYLEGNHDFNLSNTFHNSLVISREYQPLICTYNNKKIALSHGDIFMPKAYNIYTSFIRSKATGKLANILDINNIIFKNLNNWLLNKDICGNIKEFENFAQKRINNYSNYDIDYIIEGHFHQDKQYKNYINLPSLICNGRYFCIKEI
jgi:UDP-2,3-diacylglucosamine hydrolase